MARSGADNLVPDCISMNNQSLWFLVILVSLTGACTSPHERAGSIRNASLNAGTCALHNVALESRVMYDLTDPVPTDLDRTAKKLWLEYPNAQPLYATTKSRYYGKPVTRRLCPVCERLYLNGLKDRMP